MYEIFGMISPPLAVFRCQFFVVLFGKIFGNHMGEGTSPQL